ncbi:DUF29 domain-containing protein [Leptolyngbya sp. FACHB-1515]|nr:DUF29 family protein [Microcoleus sp. FACHB-1515]
MSSDRHNLLLYNQSIAVGHLLKWEYQPERRSRSWLATLRI